LTDPNKVTFTYAFQLPFLAIVWDELEEALQANGVQDLVEMFTTPSTITTGTKEWSAQPIDLIVPLFMWERAVGGSDDSWEEMDERVVAPFEQQVTTLEVWYFEEGVITFRGATTNREVLLKYQRELVIITDENTIIPVAGVKSFLQFRTAGIIARSRGNKSKADSLDTDAAFHLGQILASKVKNGQVTPVRPRPYGFSRRRNLRRD